MMKNNYPARLLSYAKIIFFTLAFTTFILGNLNAQTVLLSPTGDGGFETGTTFALNGWSTVLDANSKWYVGTFAKSLGVRGAYVDVNANAGTTNNYNSAAIRASHFYRDIAFPAGATNIVLTFKWKANGENAAGADDYDFIRVFLVSTGTTPVAATLLPSANIIGAGKYNLQSAAFQTATITLSNAVAGTSQRLVFTWRNDDSVTNNPGGAIDEVQITYTPFAGSCAPPTGLTASSITSGGATVSWTAAVPPPAIGYEYVVSTSNLTPAGSGTATAGTSVPVSGLSANTTYYLFVRSICGGANGNSTWAGPYTFTTPCVNITTIPYSEGFNTIGAYPSCWTSSLVVGTNNWVVAANDGDFIFTPHSGAGMACKNWLSGSNSRALFVSAPINLNAQPTQGVRVNVWIYRNVNGVNADQIRVLANTAPNATGATQLIDVHTLITSAPAVPSAGWYNYIGDVPLSFNAASSFYIVFEGTTTSSASSYSVGFDDFLLENQPLCNPPTGLTATGITSSGATVSWTPPAVPPGSGYEYVVSTSNVSPAGSGTPAVGTSGVVGGLSPNTTYYLFVRSICGGVNGNSTWAGPYSFITPCAAIPSSSLPYSEGFNVIGVTPACWSTALVTSTENWTFAANDGDVQFTPHSGAGMAVKNWNSAASDALLISQPFNTSALPGVANRINVWIYRNDLGVNADRVRFFVNNAPNVTGATLLIDIHPLITIAPVVAVEGWYNYTADIPLSFNSANFYIVAEGNTGGGINSYSVGFDDFMVEKVVCLSAPAAPVNGSSACPSGGSTTLSWASFGGATGYDVYLGLTNPPTTLVSANQAATSYNAGILVSGNTYYWSVVPKIGSGEATSCSSWSFTIKAVPDASPGSNSPVCEGFSLSLFGNNLGSGQTSTNWAWSGPSFTSSVQNPILSSATTAMNGTYTLTITNNLGCTASSSTSVIVNPNPVITIGSQTNVSCNGQLDGEVDLDANTGTPAYIYTLDGSPTLDGIYSGLAGGTYLAEVIDDNGCEANDTSIIIAEPALLTVAAGSNSPVCTGTPINFSSTPTGGTSGYSYSWTGPNSFTSTSATPVIASATAADAGQYDLTITDAHECTASNSHTVAIIAAPTAAANLTSTPNVCTTGSGFPLQVSLAFTGTGPWNYTVSDGTQSVSGSTSSNPASVSIPLAGQSIGAHTYTVTSITDANCPAGGTSSGSATVYVSSGPPTNTVGSPVSQFNYACSGDVQLITVNAVGGQNIRFSWNLCSSSSVVLFSNNIGGPWSPGPFQTTLNQVYAQFGAVTPNQSGYSISVQGVNGCGSTNNKCLFIRGVVSVPGTITPPNNVVACPNDVKSYSCGSSGGATQYNWTLSGSSAAITTGQGTTNVQVTFPAGFTSGQLCVTAQLPCGGSSISAPRCMSISNTPAVPGTFTAGPSSVCPGATGVTYTIPTVSGATGYNWTTPVGTTITSGQNTPSIQVSFPNPYTGAPPVCVTATSACGSSVARCKTVGSSIPIQPGAMSGPTTNICNSTAQYSVANVAGASSYLWTAPAGTTISSGQGSTTILLNVSSTFTSGFLSVTANTALCTPGSSPARTITIYGKPNQASAITANPPSFCNGGFPNFSVAATAPQPYNNWSVTNGTITAGQGTTNIDVTWGTGTGTVNVTASNTCGAANVRTQSFTGTACREEEEELDVQSSTFNVYPNPAHDKVTVSIDVKEQTQFNVKLRDISGRVILSEDHQGAEGLNAYEMDLRGFAKGIYMIEVQSGNDSWKTKVVIE